MGLETGTTIAALNAAWPAGSDARSQGDDHIRLTKAVMKADVASKALTTLQTFAGPLRISSVLVGADPAGATAGTTVSSVTGVVLNLRSGLATGTHLIQFQNAAGTPLLASIAPEGSAAPSTATVITREKGDARYLQLAGGTLTDVLTGTIGRFGNVWIGAGPDGASITNAVSANTGQSLILRSGLDAGNTLLAFNNASNANQAAIAPAGTAAPSIITIMTREKGDLRYAPKALLLAALQALSDSAPVAELRDALIGALSAPPDMSEA